LTEHEKSISNKEIIMGTLSRQIDAWKASWQRLSDDDSLAETSFLQRVGELLGETDSSAAIRLGRRIVLGSSPTTAA
jgi:hypothetical protein